MIPGLRRQPSAGLWVVLLLSWHLAASPAGGDEGTHPFVPGETLTYELGWKFIHAGTAVFEVQPMAEQNGRPAYHFLLTVRSSPLLDLFYKVRDRVEAYTDLAVTRSLLYKNEQREGSFGRDVTVTFDWEAETAQFENRGRKLDPISVYPGTFDPLSIIYHLRMQELVPGRVLEAPGTDGKRLVMGRVRVVEKQEVKVPAGRFDAFLVEPELERLGGVVERSKAAAVQIWLSADQQRIPLKVTGEAKLGSFYAVLVSVSGPTQSTRQGQTADPSDLPATRRWRPGQGGKAG